MFLECLFFLTVYSGKVIKNTMKRVDNIISWSASKGLEGNVKFSPALQKEMKEREGSRRLMTTQRQGVRLHLHVCAKGHLREEVRQAVWMKEEIRKAVVGSNFLRWKWQQQMSHWWHSNCLRATLLLCLEVFKNNKLSISSSVVFTLESQQQYLEHLTLALTFLQRYTPQWTGNNHLNKNKRQWPQLWNNSCSPWPFHRETEWMMTEDLSDKCWDIIKEMASSYQQTRTRKWRKKKKKKAAQWLFNESTD